uniref:Uncharacterized protein n=1 Tax=Triticum urartu TaxID=4572 RepID=A0A8R7PPH6_TRIUA
MPARALVARRRCSSKSARAGIARPRLSDACTSRRRSPPRPCASNHSSPLPACWRSSPRGMLERCASDFVSLNTSTMATSTGGPFDGP